MDNVSIMLSIDKKMNNILNNDADENDIFIPIYVPTKMKKKILVLSGGGIKGISFIGAMHALYELNILQNMHTFAGTSVGSMILFLYIIGYNPNELFNFIKIVDLNKLKAISIALFLESYGLDSGDKIVKTLTKFMEMRNIKSDITFMELFSKTSKTFIVTAVNINDQKIEYFSHQTSPNMSVLQAVRMSISIPFVFTPVQYNECLYVDGGCIDNFPIKYFYGREDELLGIHIINKIEERKKIQTFDEYALNVINSMINGITNTSIKNYEKYVIGIDLESVNTIDFDITTEKKIQMYNSGYNTIHSYMSKYDNS